jgi:hypothetical protein
MMRRKLRCAAHGKRPWRLTIICKDCSRVYQAVMEGDDFEPLCVGAVPAPEVCACGSTLPGEQGSARPICTPCFVLRVSRADLAGGGVTS